jgi:2-polyprenyl-3-methyl-5-hydroxy-6-metoxy-1,4-benzoquinol methylase
MSTPSQRNVETRQQLFDAYRSTGMGLSNAPGLETPRALAHYLEAVVLPLMPPSTEANIGDLACGGGDLLASLKAAGYTRLVGVDISAEQTERCHARGLEFVVKGDVLGFLGDRVDEFDCLVAMDLFEHLELTQAMELAHAIARTLRPGGWLVIQTCNANSPVFGSVRYADLTHVTAFTPLSLRQMLLATGFKSVQVRGVRPIGRAPSQLLRRAAWKVLGGLVRIYLLVETGQRHQIVSRNLIAVATV